MNFCGLVGLANQGASRTQARYLPPALLRGFRYNRRTEAGFIELDNFHCIDRGGRSPCKPQQSIRHGLAASINPFIITHTQGFAMLPEGAFAVFSSANGSNRNIRFTQGKKAMYQDETRLRHCLSPSRTR